MDEPRKPQLLRVLLIEDEDLARLGTSILVRQLDSNAVVHEARGCEEALELTDRDFGLVLLDMHLKGISDLDALGVIRSAFPQSRIVIISGNEEVWQIKEALNQGAAGYIPKSSESEVLKSALRLVLAGGMYLPPNLLIAYAPVDRGIEAFRPRLTERERRVLEGIETGSANKVIARNIGVSEATVKNDVSRVLSHFRQCTGIHVETRTDLIIQLAKIAAPANAAP